MASSIGWVAEQLLKREATDPDPDEPEAGQKEIFASWAIFILIMLLIVALFTSYLLQTKKIQAVHETVISIFTGMFVGLLLRLTAAETVLSVVTFDYQFFFNLLLPPIILASGYELHQGNFFRNIGTILTFAFAGTFISAVVLGIVLWLWTRIPLDGLNISFIEAMSVGATLSATDPVTILAIFNTYRVDPQLYTVIFGESILNDAIAIVLFETAQKYKEGAAGGKLTVWSLFESIRTFIMVFFGSLFIGLIIGIATSLLLKFTHIRRFPKIEACVVILIAYASYFFSNAIHMSGIVSLLFCGICLKHYAYHNMSRRTQLTTKFVFQVMAQLSENFIFIYLGLSLFTESELEYKPLFILITVVGICIARWCSVFPLSKAINWFIRYRARKRGGSAAATATEETLPWNHQVMLFWAGLRGAVGVALAAGLTGKNGYVLRATVLVVVVLTVIIFGGTTARMLEILGIRTGVIEEIDSDDEFDIEVVVPGGGAGAGVNGGIFRRPAGTGFGHMPRQSVGAIGLDRVDGGGAKHKKRNSGGNSNNFVNGTGRDGSIPPGGGGGGGGVSGRPNGGGISARRNSRLTAGAQQDAAEQGLLSPAESSMDSEDSGLDLPPQARRSKTALLASQQRFGAIDTDDVKEDHHMGGSGSSYPTSGTRDQASAAGEGSSGGGRLGAISGFIGGLGGLAEDPADAFRKIDEGFIKPHLLLDPKAGGGGGGSGHG